MGGHQQKVMILQQAGDFALTLKTEELNLAAETGGRRQRARGFEFPSPARDSHGVVNAACLQMGQDPQETRHVLLWLKAAEKNQPERPDGLRLVPFPVRDLDANGNGR